MRKAGKQRNRCEQPAIRLPGSAAKSKYFIIEVPASVPSYRMKMPKTMHFRETGPSY